MIKGGLSIIVQEMQSEEILMNLIMRGLFLVYDLRSQTMGIMDGYKLFINAYGAFMHEELM